jgi:hypothetical protein
VAGFDWYQATVPHPVDDVLEACFRLADRVELEHTKGTQGYACSTILRGVDGPLGRVWHGGTHAHPHVVFSGEGAQAGAELIRASFPQHRVTRIDAREDFADAGAFDRMLPVLLSAAERHRVKVDTRGDHLLRQEARTVYLGAASSAVRLRQYDKAAELRSKFAADPVRLATVPEHLTRLEAQVRPQTAEARSAFASIEPLAVMGSSGWLRDVWEGVAGLRLEPVQVGKPWRQSDDDRAYAYLLAQYGGLLERIKANAGSWACVGEQIGYDLAERAKALRTSRSRGGSQ